MAAADAAGSRRTQRRVVVNGVNLTDIGHDRGDPNAPVVVVEFSDFGCPACAGYARNSLPAIDSEFVATGKVFYKYVPFVLGSFPNAGEAARAAECAGEQERFWPMHDQLYRTQREWRSQRGVESLLTRYAATIGADTVRFAACVRSRRTDRHTRRGTDLARRLGVRATPSFFVDRGWIEGALRLDLFQALLREKTTPR